MGRPGSLSAGGRLQPRVTLRAATHIDAPLLLAWRNDPDAIRFSVTGRGVTPAEHGDWLAVRLADPHTRLWVAEEDNEAVGQVRVELSDDTGTVSIGIAPAHRGRGIGSAVLDALLVEMERDPRVNRLRAVAHPRNTASVRAFERVGFSRCGRGQGDFIVLERSVGAEH
jgi:UDP-2,4-diacetamido-2,4,6-trideoxy-beta-L-altropyranose hydrolase